ncbi:LPS export ABC transporter periplasmic protein LptC [Rhizosaccharibacter radicis]|uniref:LPS export ABC transporter periplasmic protein LptC n=1 Tax=Rhizosaccharibacter radicis TaxID=2782605 RepID=A0ABT1VVD6_9PROT|nr:LPS export ABC transporter periplasmic protein LptC [Acetobacteraceae bacterium KSS12]
MSLGREMLHRAPDSRQMARRRRFLRWTKWVLPGAAAVLLISIGAWPEISRSLNAQRADLRQATRIALDSGRLIGAHYRGLDMHNRPYTITADEAQQAGGNGDRINLTRPIADTLTQSGSWIMIRADRGVYMQHSQLLDLDGHVFLYRDDGIMMTGPTAGMDLKRGIVASDDGVHAEGPFGVLDAQGYLMSQRDDLVQFRGPSRMILNDDHVARGPAPATHAANAAAPAPARARPAGGETGR